MWGLEEHHRPRLVAQAEQSLPSLCGARRQEPLEAEPVGGDAADAERCSDRGRARHATHRDPRRSRRAHQTETRIGEQRRAGITHQGHHLSRLEPRQQPRLPTALVMGMERHHRLAQAECREQLARAAGVFCGHHVGSCQAVAGTRREITEVADRCRNDLQPPKSPAKRRLDCIRHYNLAPCGPSGMLPP